jgi:hypothetical protein
MMNNKTIMFLQDVYVYMQLLLWRLAQVQVTAWVN